MSLTEYKEKRNFNKTPEPEASETSNNKAHIFVVQRHDASHLHFDFRLEMGGVLKSWAVPKGPSMNASDKRLGIMVEDHPLDYADFEGQIPKGEYGGGTVKIWDSGTWAPEKEYQNTASALKKGYLEFFLYGKKLKGEFVLIKTNYKNNKNSWILKKKKDKYAVEDFYDAEEK